MATIREQAVELGRQDGVEHVEDVLAEQGIDGLRATLRPGHLGWDEGAINAVGFEGVRLPSGAAREDFEAYWEAYAAAAREHAAERVAEHDKEIGG